MVRVSIAVEHVQGEAELGGELQVHHADPTRLLTQLLRGVRAEPTAVGLVVAVGFDDEARRGSPVAAWMIRTLRSWTSTKM
ncbi:hypothetical protein Acsp02_89630 [Actinoplanes sp. NBRC 103695]|nr:hypothetical protein Acsp02_89630 [Actinoplanes sp. NBRC 103695]